MRRIIFTGLLLWVLGLTLSMAQTDCTSKITNPSFENDWTGWSHKDMGLQGNNVFDIKAGNVYAEKWTGRGGAEFYETTFNFYQTLKNMPAGVYQLCAQAFQRPGEPSAVYTQYKAGNSNISTQLYMGSASTFVKHICDDSQKTALNNGDKQLATGVYVPNVMDGAAQYFAKGFYDNSVSMEQTTSGANIKVGIRSTKSASYYWTMFDHFRLYFYGKNRTVVGINEIKDEEFGMKAGDAVYDLSGRRVSYPKRGIYIVNGKKIIVK